MRHLPSDKYNVAWFRLAECVARGEKERALGVYRLLAHSFGDEAFALQLMGDLLLAFDDVEAKEKYNEAARGYMKEGRMLEATSVYEHLVLLEPDNVAYMVTLAELYRQMSLIGKATFYYQRLFEQALVKNDPDNALQQIFHLEALVSLHEVTILRQKLVEFLLEKKSMIPDLVLQQINLTIDGYFLTDSMYELGQFLELLHNAGEFYYKNACAYMEAKNLSL